MKVVIKYADDTARIGTATIIPNKTRFRKDFHSMRELRFKATNVLVANGFELLHGGWNWAENDKMTAYIWKRETK